MEEHSKVMRQGLTLIELLVVIAVLGIVASAIFRYTASTSELYSMLITREALDEEVLAAASRIRREMRLTRATTVADRTDWEFVNVLNATNRLRLAGADLSLNGAPLATGVEEFALSYHDQTNGLLEPLPLGGAERSIVRRVSMEITVARGGQTSGLETVYFYPESGVTK